MAKVIGIFAEYDGTLSGPQKVLLNLARGLELLSVPYKFNDIADWNVCLQEWSRFINILPPNTLVGPNINPPWIKPEIYNRYIHFLCPSKWTYNAFRSEISPHKTLHIWPVGIDIDRYKPNNNSIKENVLIYYKNIDINELEKLKEILDKHNIKYLVLKYGEYGESTFIDFVNQSYCGILLTNTESQGIAYMEMLSMGLPLYCINREYFKYDDNHLVVADSAPYMDSTCGVKGKLDEENILQFIQNYQQFLPRNYIINNHSLEQGAAKLISIMDEIYDR